MDVHEFYKRNGLRVHEIPVGTKCPVQKGWPNAQRPYSEVDAAIKSAGFNKYGWLLDDNHAVIDIDLHNEEENGNESQQKLEAELGISLDELCGAIVYSPSGGRHYYFTKPTDVKFGKVFKGKYPGIDFISGKGKQVIAGNSCHDDYPGETYELCRGAFESICFQPMPQVLIDHLQAQRQEVPVSHSDPQDGRSGDDFNTSQRGVDLMVGELRGRGYAVRRVHDYYEIDRPGKSTDSKCSGHLGKRSQQGNYQLCCFTLSDPNFPSGESISIFHAYSLLCTGGNHKLAASQLYYRGFAEEDIAAGVDLSKLFSTKSKSDVMSEAQAKECVPKFGMLRQVFEVYEGLSRRKSNLMGLSVAISLCQTIYGRKVRSHTDLRTNDYHLIVAPTSCGKEACEKTIIKIFEAADINHDYIIPPDVQSGNGLMTALNACNAVGIWISDEFGKTLNAVLDPKSNNGHQRQIATHLLKLYGKSDSTYAGAAHSAGIKNKIVQPHLCVLGLTTGCTFFQSVNMSHVLDGLIGRIAFWVVQDRPKLKKVSIDAVPEYLADQVRGWMTWEPSLNASVADGSPNPKVIEMTPEAEARWEQHALQIDERMQNEREARAAIWGRVAARSMNLALTHRCARQEGDPSLVRWEFVQIEDIDIEWGIKVSKLLANTVCTIIEQNVADDLAAKTKALITAAIDTGEQITMRDLKRANRNTTEGEFRAAVKELESMGVLKSVQIGTGGRPKTVYQKAT